MYHSFPVLIMVLVTETFTYYYCRKTVQKIAHLELLSHEIEVVPSRVGVDAGVERHGHHARLRLAALEHVVEVLCVAHAQMCHARNHHDQQGCHLSYSYKMSNCSTISELFW